MPIQLFRNLNAAGFENAWRHVERLPDRTEAQAAESKATAVTDCAKAYVTAFGGLFEGDGPTEQAPAVRKDIEKVTAGCKTALGGG